MSIHKRKYLFCLPADGAMELSYALVTVTDYAKSEGFDLPPAVEMQSEGTPIRLDLWEETLSDGSTQLVAQLC